MRGPSFKIELFVVLVLAAFLDKLWPELVPVPSEAIKAFPYPGAELGLVSEEKGS